VSRLQHEGADAVRRPVHPPELLDRFCEEPVDLLRSRGVEWDRVCPGLPGELLQAVLGMGADDELGAALGEPAAERTPDAASGA